MSLLNFTFSDLVILSNMFLLFNNPERKITVVCGGDRIDIQFYQLKYSLFPDLDIVKLSQFVV